jgi:hypothetical protein
MPDSVKRTPQLLSGLPAFNPNGTARQEGRQKDEDQKEDESKPFTRAPGISELEWSGVGRPSIFEHKACIVIGVSRTASRIISSGSAVRRREFFSHDGDSKLDFVVVVRICRVLPSSSSSYTKGPLSSLSVSGGGHWS